MTTFISQPDEAESADTFIYNGAATTNYGTNASLLLGEPDSTALGSTYRILIKFLLDTIPANAVVSAATLYLTITADLSSVVRVRKVYRVLRAWVEAQATWNAYATGLNWGTAGATGAADIEATEIGSISLGIADTGEIGISLDPAKVQEMIAGTFANNGFLIKSDTELNDRYQFASSSDATPTRRPRMVIEYTVPGAQPVTRVIWFN